MKTKGLVAGWTLTNKCNLNCKHCYNASGKPKADELSREQAIQVAKKLVRDGRIEAVNFGGGECALRDDFLDLVTIFFESGIKVSYTSNGTTYHKLKAHLHKFSDIGVSMEFIDPKKQNEFRRWYRNFEYIEKAIDFFVSHGVNTEIVTCLTALNCDRENILGIYNFAKKHNVNFWRFNRYRTTGRTDSCNELELTPKMLKEVYELLVYLRGESTYLTPDPLFSLLGGKFIQSGCPCGTSSFRILANGEVSPCTYLHISGGNILKNSIDNIMNSSVFKALRERKLVGKCIECPVSSVCKGGCGGATYTKYKTFDKPDPLCWYEPGMKIDKMPKLFKGRWGNVHEGYLCTMYVPIRK